MNDHPSRPVTQATPSIAPTTRRARHAGLPIVLLALVQLAACAPTEPAEVASALTQAQARALAENALTAFDAGDFAGWSRDWSPNMKAAIREEDFLAFREQAMGASGRYRAVATLELVAGQTSGYVRWNVLANFERGQIRFGFGFRTDGTLVEGVFPEAVD